MLASDWTADHLDDQGQLERQCEEVGDGIKEMMDETPKPRDDQTSEQGENEYLEKFYEVVEEVELLASKVLQPLRLSSERMEEFWARHPLRLSPERIEEVKVECEHIRRSVVKFVTAFEAHFEPLVNKIVIPKETWQAFYDELDGIRTTIKGHIVKVMGWEKIDNGDNAKPALSWNWADSHIPGLRWIQKKFEVEVWRPAANAKDLDKVLNGKVVANRDKYKERRLKIRDEETRQEKPFPNVAAAIKWLDLYGKDDREL